MSIKSFQIDNSILNETNVALLNDSKQREVAIAWENINVHYNREPNLFEKAKCRLLKREPSKSSKHIINNVNGIARQNEVLAIMGSSGSGKTTLLNALNFRNQGSLTVNGEIKLNGQGVNSIEAISKVSGYVQQDDVFIGTLKVKEHLFFQAMLRIDKKHSREEKLERIEQVMVQLNLKKCENAIIGLPERGIKGISGGERRRLAFASEIMTNPSILFCDEPTTGLDSVMAMSVVECIKSLARAGKTVICTIHQPSSDLFEMFDKLLLMSEGRVAFLGSRLDALDFFESHGFKCPENYNPADFYIKTLSITTADKKNCLDRVKKICDGFQETESYLDMQKEISKKWFSQIDLNNKAHIGNTNRSFKANTWTQFRWLFWRNFVDQIRDPLSLRVLVAQTIVMSLLYGLIFFRLELNQEGIQNINGALFVSLVNYTFGSIFYVVNSFHKDTPVFLREHQNGIYKVLPYYLAKSFIDVNFFFIQ